MFGKIKQALGVGGIKVQVIVDPNIPAAAQDIMGKLVINTQSDQHIEGITVKMLEQYRHTVRVNNTNEQRTETREIGRLVLTEVFDIKPGEMREVPFILSFRNWVTATQAMAQQGGVIGAIGKVAAFVENERNEYFIEGDVRVKGQMFATSNRVRVNLL